MYEAPVQVEFWSHLLKQAASLKTSIGAAPVVEESLPHDIKYCCPPLVVKKVPLDAGHCVASVLHARWLASDRATHWIPRCTRNSSCGGIIRRGAG